MLLVLGGRAPRLPFHIFFVGWHLLLAAVVLRAARSDPEGFRFRGDSLGIDVSLAWIGPLLFGLPAALAAWWAWRDLRSGTSTPVAPWTPQNTRWLVGLLLLLPVQFGLLRFGAPGSGADVAGVLLTILQWLLIGRALRPRAAPAAG
jgi:hypothetical protein